MEIAFRLTALVLLSAALTISIYYRHRAEKQGGTQVTSKGDARLIVMRLVGLVGFIPLILYIIHPQWVAWARFSAPDWLRWTAMFVAALMIPCIYWLFSTIGNNISPRETTREGHKLVVTGPYRYIRHPLYTFGALFFLALCLGVTIWWTLAILALGFAMLMLRTPLEEANLVAQFGDDYRRYMARTGRYLPKFGSLRSV